MVIRMNPQVGSIANPNLPPPPSGKYPAKDHCRRVAKWIAAHGGQSEGVIYLEGQTTAMVEARLLEQRSYRIDVLTR